MSAVVTIVQARMGSSRLPGKVLAEIGGRPMLAHVMERAASIPGVEKVMLATSVDPRNEPLLALAASMGIEAYAGSESDVLDRYYQAANKIGADVVVRVTADCPLLDPHVSGLVVSCFMRGDVDYASNAHPATYPDGLDTEVFAFSALDRAWREAALPSEREHVTPFIWKRTDIFRTANVTNDVDLSAFRWTVDNPEDLELVRAIDNRMHMLGRLSYGLLDIIQLLREEPELSNLNRHVPRDAGYAKSVAQDEEQMQRAQRRNA